MPTTPCTSSKHKALSSSTNQSVSGQVALKPADLNRSGIIRESSKYATKHNKLQSDALELRSWDESNTLVTKQTLSGLTEPDPFGFLNHQSPNQSLIKTEAKTQTKLPKPKTTATRQRSQQHENTTSYPTTRTAPTTDQHRSSVG